MGRSEQEAYAHLAAAVIEQAVKELRGGTAAERKRVLSDIEYGGLEPWIDLLCTSYDMYEGVKRRLERVMQQAVACCIENADWRTRCCALLAFRSGSGHGNLGTERN